MLHVLRRVAACAGAATLLSLVNAPTAEACGCFVQRDPTVPVIQAGERILFAINNGVVTAHIQISYSGSPSEFGWLLPLPSVPTMQLGTDELFNQLYNTTQPRYGYTTTFQSNSLCAQRNFVGPTPNTLTAAGGNNTDTTPGGPNPLVVQGSIGPFDYAVLKADDQTAMLAWLNTNSYFIPTGTDQTVSAYIHPGAYFLALKLKPGEATGALQPVVVQYPSDLPMIPIVLTSVAAQPNMGIQVWMLGNGRAIPRNYFHTVIDDALIDWIGGATNYNDVIIKAVGEADGKHSFVTEYAGSSSVMQHVLNPPGRFGDLNTLATQPDPVNFVQYLYANGYGSGGLPASNGSTQVAFTSALDAILAQYIPEPPVLAQQSVTLDQWFAQLGTYLSPSYQQQNPATFVGWTGVNYQPRAMAQQIDASVVQPTLAAGALFDQSPKLTRLYTTLSPEDMNKDPVFSYNASLPDVGFNHQAKVIVSQTCGIGTTGSSTELITEQGWQFAMTSPRTSPFSTALYNKLPGSLRIEILPEEGGPQVVRDNSGTIGHALGQGCGCGMGGDATTTSVAALLISGFAMAGRRRRTSL